VIDEVAGVLDLDGRWFVQASYGETGWVANLRADASSSRPRKRELCCGEHSKVSGDRASCARCSGDDLGHRRALIDPHRPG
jgi:hypothetical protein